MRNVIYLNVKELSEQLYDELTNEGKKIEFITEMLINCDREIIKKIIKSENDIENYEEKDLYIEICKCLKENNLYNQYITNIMNYLKYVDGPVEMVNVNNLLKGNYFKEIEKSKLRNYVDDNVYKLFCSIKEKHLEDIIKLLNKENDGRYTYILEDVADILTTYQIKRILRDRLDIQPHIFEGVEKIIGYGYKNNNSKSANKQKQWYDADGFTYDDEAYDFGSDDEVPTVTILHIDIEDDKKPDDKNALLNNKTISTMDQIRKSLEESLKYNKYLFDDKLKKSSDIKNDIQFNSSYIKDIIENLTKKIKDDDEGDDK